PLKPHPLVEPMRLVEARVRPENESANLLRAAPVEHGLDERAAGAAAAQAGVEVETMKLGAAIVQPLDAHRADDHVVLAHDEERASGRRVVLIEPEQIRDR